MRVNNEDTEGARSCPSSLKIEGSEGLINRGR